MAKYNCKLNRKAFEKGLNEYLEVLKAELLGAYDETVTESSDSYTNDREENGLSHKEAKEAADELFSSTIESLIEEKTGDFMDDIKGLFE